LEGAALGGVMRWILSGLVLTLLVLTLGLSGVVEAQNATPPLADGTMVDLGGHRLHFECVGTESPTVIVESGFDEFSFDWIAVQTELAKTNRVCTYDRAGHASSDPGPKPRTFAQINLELHDALEKLNERPPYILVGHAFGAAIVRNYAITYPAQVAALVFVDGVSEDQRFEMWHRAVLMRDGAKGKIPPGPRETIVADDKVEVATYYRPSKATSAGPPFDQLPLEIQKLHLWAQSQRSLAAAEENEREWSPEYFAKWHAEPGVARLGAIPLIVVTREEGGFHDLDISAAQQETERKQTQLALAMLSSRGKQKIIVSGENTEIDNPTAIVEAVRDVSKETKSSSAAAGDRPNVNPSEKEMPTTMNSAEILKRYVAAINSHDAAAVKSLMAEDHQFVDSLGNRMRGASSVEAGWQAYFTMCPDYWIRADSVIASDDVVLAAGEAGGTIDGEPWRIPAAWKAIIRDGHVVEWQVFADNKPVYEILGRRKQQ
jgi:pimeloyl-ACP methyl ester carboxylesterase/ketosteroid isomerase-like protein